MNQQDFVIRQLYCPFPPEVNRHVDAVHEHTLAWARQFGLAKDESGFERVRESKFARLVARAYPSSPRDELAIVADWNTWLFLLDDECDESGIGRRPDRLAALHARCFEVLSGKALDRLDAPLRPRPGRADVPLLRALHELRGRMGARMPRAWVDRFAVSVAEYFEAAVWEARNRERGVWPNSATYIQMRPYTGALYTVLDLIDLTEAAILPLVVRKHPLYQALMLITNNVVCWCNDLFSLPKERAHGDMHNLALILQHQEAIGVQDAVDRVVGLIEQEIERFIALENDLPSFGAEVDGLVRRFVAVLRAWMRGNLDWSYESGRYQVPDYPITARPAYGDTVSVDSSH